MTKPTISYYYQITTHHLEVIGADDAPASAEHLYAALQDKNSEVQVSAALGLVKLGDHSPNVVDALFRAADWRSHPEAGILARKGIVELAKTDPAMIDLLLAALKQAKGKLSGVAECLGEIGQATDAVISGLLYFSHRSKDSYAAICAIHSLLQLGYQDEVINTLLVRKYHQGDGLVQSVALQAIGLVEQPPPEMVRLLLIRAGHSSNWETRSAAIQGLGRLIEPSPAVIDVLCNALADPEWFVRTEAIVSLGTLGRSDLQIIDGLLSLLDREEQKEQKRAAQATPKVSSGKDVPDPLAALAELDDSQSLRGTVAMTLAHLGCRNEKVIAAFLNDLNASDASVRERIVRNWWLLGKDNPIALNALQTAQQDESEMVRNSVAESWHWLQQDDEPIL